jgi:hypothetical protein
LVGGWFWGSFAYVGVSWIIAGAIYKFAERDMTEGAFLAALLLGAFGAIAWIVIDTSRRETRARSWGHGDRQRYYKRIAQEDYRCGNCSWFGSMSEPESTEEREIDFYSEVEVRLKQEEEHLRIAREIENKGWKTFFAEQFLREIGQFPKKEKMPNAVLHKEVAELLNMKKKNEIVPLEKTLELFSTNSVIQEMDKKLE